MGDNRQIGIKCLKSEMRSLFNLLGDGRKIHRGKKYLHSAPETWRDLNVIEHSRAQCADRFPTHITRSLTRRWAPSPALDWLSPWGVEGVECPHHEAEFGEISISFLKLNTYKEMLMLLPLCHTHLPTMCAHTGVHRVTPTGAHTQTCMG